MCKYSVVIPAYNEGENLTSTHSRLTNVLRALKDSYEIIFVNDGSTDHSLQILEQLRCSDDKVRIIDFSRNFGHQLAITAGIEFASGKAVIIMDADLQHPPEIIPEMIRKWKEGFEIVYTIREKTEDQGTFKRISSSLFYKLLNKITDINISENAPDFRLLDRKVVESLKCVKERARFVRGLIKWIGFNQTAIRFTAPPRSAGKTKYTFGKMLKFSFDGITSFSSFPLKLASHFGFLVSFAGFIYALYAIYMKLFTDSVIPGWTSILITVLLISGVQLITIGIMGEYISRIYEECKGRPLYIIRKAVGFSDNSGSEKKRVMEAAVHN